MKRLFSAFILLCSLCSLLGCMQSLPESSSASVTMPTEVWYEKMSLNFHTRWSMPVVEVNEVFYYLAEDGIYRYEKSTETDERIIAVKAYGLLIYANILYYNTGHEIKCMDIQTGEISVIWEETMLPDASEMAKRYVSVCDFQIVDGYLYLAITGTSAMRVHLDTGVSEMFLNDFSEMVIVGDSCYYLDHAERTFSIYHMDCDTKEVSLLRGEGQSEPSPEQMRIDGIVAVGNDIYYTVRDTSDVYQLNPNGSDIRIADGDDGDGIWICLVDRNAAQNLYYYTADGAQLKLYRHDLSDEDTLVLSTAFDAISCDMAITNSVIFYKSSDEGTVQSVERQ